MGNCCSRRKLGNKVIFLLYLKIGITKFILIFFFILILISYIRFVWTRTSTILGHSQLEVSWEIPRNTEPGLYRLRHFGAAKHIIGGIKSYVGTTNVFDVSN